MPYFRMNNDILDLGLTPNEIKVAVCLYSCVFRNHYSVQIKQSTIADKCGIKKVETVSKIIYKLQKLGVIKRIERPLKSNGWFGTSVYKLKSVAVRRICRCSRRSTPTAVLPPAACVTRPFPMSTTWLCSTSFPGML